MVDGLIVLRILYLLVKPFTKYKAYQLGLIDDRGNRLKKAETSEEKKSDTMLFRLVWNLKRMIAMVPGGNSKIGTLAAAYLLVREAEDMDETSAQKLVSEEFAPTVQSMETTDLGEFPAFAAAILEDAGIGNVTGAPVSTDQPVVNVKKRPYQRFDVDDQTFEMFHRGRHKFRRWSKWLNMSDPVHRNIYEYSRSHDKGIALLVNSKGQMRGVRYNAKGLGAWHHANQPGKLVAESVVYDTLEVVDLDD